MAVDVQRGIVFVPTGSAAADFYGANRRGDNLFANSLLAPPPHGRHGGRAATSDRLRISSDRARADAAFSALPAQTVNAVRAVRDERRSKRRSLGSLAIDLKYNFTG